MKDQQNYLWIDQYGQPLWAHNRKELIEKHEARHGVVGKVSIMYRDKKSGPPVRAGYVIGRYWYSQYLPVEKAA